MPPAPDNTSDSDSPETLQILRRLDGRMGDMEKRMDGRMEAMEKRMEERENAAAGAVANVVQEEESDDSESGDSEADQADNAEQLTPKELRRDFKLMARAARRLAAFGKGDFSEEDSDGLSRGRSRGTKSGSAMVASEKVRKRIDWPHMHVKRLVAGRRRTVTYSELKVEEFVLGFITMLQKPQNKLDIMTMIEILRMNMKDTIDFSWHNASNLYEMLGIDVEQGYVKWQDSEVVQRMRMTYAHTAYPEKKEQKETPKNQPRAAPTGMKCCAAFKTRACEHTRDHHPYTHACGYCFKTSNIIARHAEEDCFKKIAQETKKREKEGAIVLPLKDIRAAALQVQGPSAGQAPTAKDATDRNIVQDPAGEVKADVSTEREDIHCNRAVQAVALSQNFAPAASKNATQKYLRQGCDTVILQHACVRHLAVVTKTK